MAPDVTTLHVDAPGSGYDVLLGEGLLERLPSILDERGFATRTAVVTNDTLAPLYGQALDDALPDAFLVTVPDGEQYKSLDTLRTIYSALVEGGLGRDGLVVALGGGVVGDMAGYAAATYMRGVRLVQAPTSLLAMVDASVGGKVAVDLPEGKNLVGAFKQPGLVVIDPSTLKTLPHEELRAGLAEVVKAGFISDIGLLDLLQGEWQPEREEIIRRALSVKIEIVEKDPLETGVRAHLNLGHTFAHAFEVCSNFTWRHGEAVAVGLVAAAHLSVRLEMADHALVDQVKNLLVHLELPVSYNDGSQEELWAAMARDKKAHAGARRFVLLKQAGQIEVVSGVSREDVLAVLEQIRET
jgi:3-dehydroquinate synthase